MLGPLHIEQVLRWLPTFEETVDGRYMTMPILTLLEELCFFVLFVFIFSLFLVCLFCYFLVGFVYLFILCFF